MNQNEPTIKPEESVELDIDPTSTVEDFIKELEAKEKDLHITSDLTIEVEESEFDGDKIPEFLRQELDQAQPLNDLPRPPVGPKTRIYELEQEVDRLNERIAMLRADRNEIQEKSDRRLKDFESYKYRMDRERRGAFIDQICNLAAQMLPVLDNFDRALEAANKLNGTKSPDFQQFYDGVVLVHQQVTEIFAGMGVERIKSVGESFDPNLHEAVSAETRSDLPANTIIQELLSGYRIGNRVIRHSMVRVTSAPVSQRGTGFPDQRPTAAGLVDLDPEAAAASLPIPPNSSNDDTH